MIIDMKENSKIPIKSQAKAYKDTSRENFFSLTRLKTHPTAACHAPNHFLSLSFSLTAPSLSLSLFISLWLSVGVFYLSHTLNLQ